MSFAEQLRRAEQLAKAGSLVIGGDTDLNGGSPEEFRNEWQGGWAPFSPVIPQSPLGPWPFAKQMPEQRREEPMEVHFDWKVKYLPPEEFRDAEPLYGIAWDQTLTQTPQYSKEEMIATLRSAIEKMQFKPPAERCELDACLDLDSAVIKRCNFPGRTSYRAEFKKDEGTYTHCLCVHKEGQVGVSGFSPSTSLDHAFEAAERTGIFRGRVLFYDPDAGWFLMHDDEYEAGMYRGRRGAKKAAVAICRAIVDSIPITKVQP